MPPPPVPGLFAEPLVPQAARKTESASPSPINGSSRFIFVVSFPLVMKQRYGLLARRQIGGSAHGMPIWRKGGGGLRGKAKPSGRGLAIRLQEAEWIDRPMPERTISGDVGILSQVVRPQPRAWRGPR